MQRSKRGNTSFFNLQDLFKAVKEIPLEYVCSRYGIRLVRGRARCPFHDDKHPSFTVKEQRWACWTEGINGDGIDLVARLYRISLKGAAEMIAQDFGLPLPDMSPEERFRARLASFKAKAKRELEARACREENKAYQDLCSLYRVIDKTCSEVKTPEDLNTWRGDLFHIRESLERVIEGLQSPSPEIKQAALSNARVAGWL